MKQSRLTNASRGCVLLFFFLACAGRLAAQMPGGNNLAPGAPGRDAQWPSAGKTAVGTSNTLESKVWFTLRAGVLEEVYYPTVDVANSQQLQFVVVSAGGRRVETEADDATHRVELLDPQALTYRQTNTAKSGAWSIAKTYTADPERSSILIDVEFRWNSPGYCGCDLYLYYDPSLNNSGMHDSAWREGPWLVASDADKTSALTLTGGFDLSVNGYLGTSDGLTQLRRDGRLTPVARAADGNVVQVARAYVPYEPARRRARLGIVLAFGREAAEAIRNAQASVRKGFAASRAHYEAGWYDYVRTLRRVAPKYQRQFDVAAMVLRAHEDKTFRGAQIASLSVPWGGGASANEPNVGGYHLVWSRDLYQVATALYASGDKAGADRALDYLFRVQQKPDGSFPQNSWLDGRPFWGSLQLDEVAYPLVLAYALGRTDNETWTKHVRPAANFILRTGPYTPQERWEEESGYSPSTIAAEIAGLVCAAEIARRNDAHAESALYLAAADDWARKVESWTATTTGKYADGNYYLRVTENEDPNDGEPRELNNGAGTFDEREIVDMGFLELVRLGVKRADDPLVAKSLAVVDQSIKVETPNGPAWYRYSRDGYGEMDDGRPWNFDGRYTGKGRLWALLSGERGQYELARGEREAARARLDHLLGFANEGLMIPEQVWDKPQAPRADFKFGEGTGSATPLAWSMAQFIRLASNLEEGRNLETPDIVAARYAAKPPPPNAGGSAGAFPDAEVLRRLEAGTTFRVGGPVAPGTRLYAMIGGEARELTRDAAGRAELNFRVPEGETTVAVATMKENGATGFTRVRLRGLTREELRADEAAAAPPKELIERLRQSRRSPVVEQNRATFLYKGSAKRVEVVGDFTGWSPRGLLLRELPGTDLKYLTREFTPRARVEYKLIADGEWIEDPLNPDRIDNGVGGFNNFFSMPGYRPAPEGPRELRGKIEQSEVPTRLLEGGRRKIQVYLPPGYAQSGERLPVLYLQDGSDYLRRARAAQTAEQLISQGRLRPLVIVFVDPADRTKEYWADDRFADFMATELVPFIDARYRTNPTRDARALLGASLGSVISVWTALRHPDTFARVGGQSSAFWIDDEKVVGALAQLEPASPSGRRFRFYFDAGLMESPWEVSRRTQVMLRGKGYPVTYREFEAGHNWTAWRDNLAEALVALWQD